MHSVTNHRWSRCPVHCGAGHPGTPENPGVFVTPEKPRPALCSPQAESQTASSRRMTRRAGNPPWEQVKFGGNRKLPLLAEGGPILTHPHAGKPLRAIFGKEPKIPWLSKF